MGFSSKIFITAEVTKIIGEKYNALKKVLPKNFLLNNTAIINEKAITSGTDPNTYPTEPESWSI